jgi:hypothetical protein
MPFSIGLFVTQRFPSPVSGHPHLPRIRDCMLTTKPRFPFAINVGQGGRVYIPPNYSFQRCPCGNTSLSFGMKFDWDAVDHQLQIWPSAGFNSVHPPCVALEAHTGCSCVENVGRYVSCTLAVATTEKIRPYFWPPKGVMCSQFLTHPDWEKMLFGHWSMTAKDTRPTCYGTHNIDSFTEGQGGQAVLLGNGQPAPYLQSLLSCCHFGPWFPWPVPACILAT